MNEASRSALQRHGRAVVLVETSDPYSTVPDCVPLLDAGYDVVVCGGSRLDQLCPVLDGLPCPLAREADVVINAVDDPTTQAAIVDGMRGVEPDVTIVVIAGSAGAIEGCVRYPDLRHAARHLGAPEARRCTRHHQPALTVFA